MYEHVVFVQSILKSVINIKANSFQTLLGLNPQNPYAPTSMTQQKRI